MKCTLARLVSIFEFTLQQPADSVTYFNTLTLPIKGTSKYLHPAELFMCVTTNAVMCCIVGGLQVAAKEV